ncbi:Carboxylesterase 4A [Chionoecetes opilio]|uniref:Carboxylic ester hydrolase n=1 Tax=Chionoecetes opilio TaxID=41210 RepID=A0A8J4YDC3_CHIOP|nr:Carboxylesterase 4A [Chionoecetes opilio]
MRHCLLVLLVGAAGVLGAGMPPLLPYTHARATTPSDDLPPVQINWGLTGVVTEEMWEDLSTGKVVMYYVSGEQGAEEGGAPAYTLIDAFSVTSFPAALSLSRGLNSIPPPPFIRFTLPTRAEEEEDDPPTKAKREASPLALPPTIVHNSLNGAEEPVTLIGKPMKTIKNRPIYAFQGIMYSEAMVGDLRFKPSIPKMPYWGNDTELDLTHLGFMCPQKSMIGGVPIGNEDCLSLNVYTPFLPADDLPGGELLPVMFFVHGGAFIGGDSSLYLPTKLLDHNVMLVVIHYRLGNLGFFSLDNDDAPGNAGLWDQITALRWVQDNIEDFGGDSDRVTIFGESAGSASVNYLMLLPEAAGEGLLVTAADEGSGLFHGVIGESGSALEHWSHDPDPVTSAEVVGAFNNCPTDNHTILYECMRDMDADDLSISMAHFVAWADGFQRCGACHPELCCYKPSVEKHPLQYLKDGNFTDVPLMIGTNKHEGSYVLTSEFWGGGLA